MEIDFWEEVDNFFSTAWEQVSNQSVRRGMNESQAGEFYFTLQFYQTAAEHSLSEEDALDVYLHGEMVVEGKAVREYTEYELGITYFVDPQTGRRVITSIWKQELH